MKKYYRVRWETEMYAESPEEAARLARYDQMRDDEQEFSVSEIIVVKNEEVML